MRAPTMLGIALLVVLVASASATPVSYTINYVNSELVITEGGGGIADAVLDIQSSNSTGWSTLKMKSRQIFALPVTQYAHAAGVLEGYITADLIWKSYISTLASSFDGNPTSVPSTAATFLDQNIAWTESMIKKHSSDRLWFTVGYTHHILKGMVEGYNRAFKHGLVKSAGARALTLTDLWFLNSDGDMEEIAVLDTADNGATWQLNKEMPQRRRLDLASGKPVTRQPIGSHCSVLVKATPDFSNIFFGHTTWEDYVQMLRIYKSYDYFFYGPKVSFSSYPAVVTSIDDFYITSNKLAVTETTNGIFSDALYNKIVPQALLSWQRAMVANINAASCVHWMALFGQHNSGTYNNQWICLDYNRFTPGKSLKDETLMIGEQIPGLWMTADVTRTLALGYWPSYNIPYFKEIYDLSGFNTQVDIGDFYNYELCPRAKIFRRDQSTVSDITSMQHIMRYNNWRQDPFSEGNPCNAISSRCDLVEGNSPNPDTALSAFGSVDGKVTDFHLASKGQAWIQAGPTWDTQPVFTWNNAKWTAQPHEGQPTTFKFPWVPTANLNV